MLYILTNKNYTEATPFAVYIRLLVAPLRYMLRTVCDCHTASSRLQPQLLQQRTAKQAAPPLHPHGTAIITDGEKLHSPRRHAVQHGYYNMTEPRASPSHPPQGDYYKGHVSLTSLDEAANKNFPKRLDMMR